jgi:hypothetical protein
MSERDFAIRKTAVPFTALPFGVAFGRANTNDSIQIGSPLTGEPFGTTPALRVMRLSKPDRGNMIQAYLNLFMTVVSPLTAKVAIGKFMADGVTAATPTQAEIDAGHLALTGTTAEYASSGGNLIVDGLNVLKKIPKKGDAEYNENGIVLIVQFSRDLSPTNDTVRRFELSCAMEMGLR